MNRTPEQLAKELSELKWGDHLSTLELTANEAHELGKAFVELQAKYAELQEEYDFRVTC